MTTATETDTLTNTQWMRTMAMATDSVAIEAYAKLTEMVNEQGYPLDDIRDFIDNYGAKAFVDGHYETWEGLNDQGCSMEAIEAFVEEFGIEKIDSFEDSYRGKYDSGTDYARDLVESGWNLDNIPSFIEIDWEKTWDNLSQDYTEVDGHIFSIW